LPVVKIIARLDALLLVLKSCKAKTCIDPWNSIHPRGDVTDLRDALASKFDVFYAGQNKVAFTRCAAGQLLDVEGPMKALVYKSGAMWHEWT
jgi:N-acetylglucosamine-6-sulfatase